MTAKDSRLLAVCGKGGVGKTAFTAMMSKVLMDSEDAGNLLLIDADPAKGLTIALDVEVKRTMGEVREEIIEASRRATQEEKQQLSEMIDYMVLEALTEYERFGLLAMGRSESKGCFCPVNTILRGMIEELSGNFDTILIDGEAGVEQINRQVMRRVDTLIIVSDATSRGLQTASLVKQMVEDEGVIQCGRLGLVLNRVQGNEELVEEAAAKVGVEVFGYIPQDEAIAYHDLVGKPLTELPPDSPGLLAVREIVERKILLA
ncbi:MAG: AAA family ATPase [Deltaproteobacteria bacterium]|nr:AAA family ATPase [Deltaproteobacteria bacterium]MBW2419211.1 AAA family ATPase [Deltaproteobacteria bacterium]